MTVRFLQGDVFEQMATLPDESVDCIVTSPPYWGLRDYGVPGQIGMEPTFAEHVEVIVRVMRECRRVLKKTGTCWFNYGDAYATQANGRSAADTKKAGKDDRTFRDKPFSTVQGNLKSKDLIMMPARIAIVLQEDGWWVRSEIVWHKPNPMPESVKDRPGSAHEKIFLLTKSPKYFYDHEAVRVPFSDATIERLSQPNFDNQTGGSKDSNDGNRSHRKALTNLKKKVDKQRGHARRHAGFNDRWDQMTREEQQAGGANLKNVWTIATHAFPEAHFATFPPALAETCIKAGCPKGGVVLDPFGGAGTTAMVADRLQRDAIIIELNPEYMEIAKKRIEEDAGMFMEAAE